ncbi:GlxA family transcriptional regulator [Cupriavidus gilardii]|uniref:GlxA family transcriptional regulator n=1 Tax=Cupriavidus gilardii TaxID=82541 RepID=A0ABY4VK06_9BURK|nr:GlxA family transcriptional regulator [Cupriavidus gilardii]MCT9071568.1 GlxA family transcriptional regulator [Cupriavidus gilardii]QKS61638.1 GlxA family transcriptional regulator [Cupriavidus gilardii]USE77405.1 GlxA family transcriptional regulator [Cupriavidus gilardii]UXC39148.1 GlxA family transcriptional regulator [Cupriavidus gilardii]
MSQPSPAPHQIDLVVYPGFKAMEAVGPMTVFDYANLQLARRGQPPAYRTRIVSTRVGPVRSDTLMTLEATARLDTVLLPDTAVIVGARDIEGALRDAEEIVPWARAVAPRIGRLVALCSGSFFLAAAGLLDGKRATTHWSVAPLLRQRYPAVAVDPDAIFVRQGTLWTSAGVTAGIDLALAIVEEDLGREIALDLARELVVFLKRPGGQSQFSVHLASQTTGHAGVREVQDWILRDLTRVFTMSEMAARAAMSERNFRRVFARETGASPTAFIESARLEAARRLLEQGELPLKAVAARSGFGSDEALRRAFLRHLGITPRDYRQRFGAAA